MPMLNFFLSFVVFGVTTFLLALSVRYGIDGAGRLDRWILSRRRHSFEGYDWYFRIPTAAGAIPEYLFAMVLSREHYFRTNWWALKISSFISVLLFVAMLKSRSGVESYYSLDLIRNQGFAAIFTSGTFFWYMNIISLLYTVLIVLITLESIKVAGVFAPLRTLVYLLLSFLMAVLTVATMAVITFTTLIYIVWKVISFLFFSNRSSVSKAGQGDKRAEDILREGFSGFKRDLDEWTSGRKSLRRQEKVPAQRKKPVITHKRATHSGSIFGDDTDIPRLYPD
ncbi:MAG: hypothetical protein RBT02_01700 [Bacteroidales bacterium]|nr:hypothetical protein [Bacteroidales bacterium]